MTKRTLEPEQIRTLAEERQQSETATLAWVAEALGTLRPVPGRAYTAEQKRAVLDRLLAAWLRAGDMRLGQLLVNANHDHVGADIFYVEDDALAAKVERFVNGTLARVVHAQRWTNNVLPHYTAPVWIMVRAGLGHGG